MREDHSAFMICFRNPQQSESGHRADFSNHRCVRVPAGAHTSSLPPGQGLEPKGSQMGKGVWCQQACLIFSSFCLCRKQIFLRAWHP